MTLRIPDTRRPTRRELASIASLGSAHAAIGMSSVIRLPFLVEALGQRGYGLYFAVGCVTPVLLSVANGLRTTTRTLVSERSGARGENEAEDAFSTSAGLARVAGLIMVVVGLPLALYLPLRDWLGGEGAVSETGMAAVLVATLLLTSLAVPGGAAWGRMEADGQQASLHAIIGGVAVVGLVVTVTMVQLTDDFASLAILNAATTAAPFYLAWMVTSRRPARQAPRLPTSAESACWPAMAFSVARAFPPHATRTIDPFVISGALGPASAAVYGIAQRLSTLNTLVVQALSPIISSDRARARGQGVAVGRGPVMRSAATQAAIAGGAGTLLWVVGPALSRVLTGGSFEVPRSIFAALLALGIAYSAAEALSTTATGPSGLRIGTRIEVIAVVVNLMLSVVFVGPLGIAGPIWASVVAAVFCVAGWAWAFGRHPALVSEVHLEDPIRDRLDLKPS